MSPKVDRSPLKWQCGHCGLSCVLDRDFLSHILVAHSEMKIFRCKLCRFSTNEVSVMERHQSVLHKPVSLIPRRKLPYSGDISDIIPAIHYRKLNCGVLVGSLLEAYQSKSSGDSILMDKQLQVIRFYNKSINSTSRDFEHVVYPLDRLFPSVHIGGKTIQCLYCHFNSESCSLQHLLYHVIEFHSTVKPFSCSDCQFKSNCRDRVHLHILIEHESDLFMSSIVDHSEKGGLLGLISVREYRTCFQLVLDDSILTESAREVEIYSQNEYMAMFLECKKLKGGTFFDQVLKFQLCSSKRFRCARCSFSCDRSSVGDLLSHMVSTHFDGINLFTCNVCGHVDSSPGGVFSHQSSAHRHSGLASVYGYYEDVLCHTTVTHHSKEDTFKLNIECTDSEDEVCSEKKPAEECGQFCNYCGLFFRSYEEAVTHLVSAHSTLTPFVCEECDFATGSVYILRQHCDTAHNSARSVGRIIEDSAISQLIRSISKKQNTFLYFVDSVNTTLSEKTSRPSKNVKNVSKNVQFVCLHCLSVSCSLEDLQEHILWSHHNSQQLFTRIQLSADCEGIMLSEAADEGRTLKCHFCEFRTARQCELLGHLPACLNGRQRECHIQCVYCDYCESGVTHSLVEHIQTQHVDSLLEGHPIRTLLQIGDLCITGVAPWPYMSEDKEETPNLESGVVLCFHCGKELDRNEVWTHFETEHSNLTRMDCLECVFKSNSLSDYELHCQQHDECQIPELFEYRRVENGLQVRCRVGELNSRPFFCGHCGFFKDFDIWSVKKHISELHGNLLEMSTPHFSVKVHKSGDKTVSLSFNQSVLSRPPLISAGELAYVSVGVRICEYKCRYCEHVENSLDLIRGHLVGSHRDLWNFKCIYCMTTKSEQADIFQHNLSFHREQLNEINLNSLIFLELPGEGSTVVVGVNSTGPAPVLSKPVKWCCGYCGEEPLSRSRDGVLRHISRVHRSNVRVRCQSCDFVSPDEYRLVVHYNQSHEGIAKLDQYSLLDTTSMFSESGQDVVVAVQIRRDCQYLTNCSVLGGDESSIDLSFYQECGVKPEGIALHRAALARIQALTEEERKTFSRCTPLSIENPLFTNLWYRRAPEDGGGRYVYYCTNCQYKTTLTADVTRHILSLHIYIYPFKCPLCPNRGIRASNISKHLVDCHPQSTAQTKHWSVFNESYYDFLLGLNNPSTNQTVMLSCIECNGYAVSIHDCQAVYRMKHHVFRHLNIKPFRCVKCSSFFSGKSNTVRHLQALHGVSKEVANDYVSQELSDEDAQRALEMVSRCAAQVDYKVIKHRGGYKCVSIDSPEPPFVPESEQESIKSGPITRKCPLCDRMFPSCEQVGVHLNEEHTSLRGIYTCLWCMFSTECWEDMVGHVMDHIGYNMHVCGVCNLGFPRASQTESHIRGQHGSSELAILTVSDERKDGELSCALKKILKSIKVNKPADSFSSLIGGLGPLKVQRAGESDVGQSTKQIKLITSNTSTEKSPNSKVQYTCSRCSYSASKWHSLKMHLAVHFDYSLRFKCSVCLTRFRDAYTTNNHASDKHPGVPYEVLRISHPETEKLIEDELINCVKLNGSFNSINVSKMKFSSDAQKRKFAEAIEKLKADCSEGCFVVYFCSATSEGTYDFQGSFDCQNKSTNNGFLECQEIAIDWRIE